MRSDADPAPMNLARVELPIYGAIVGALYKRRA
jgi:hypothetical protein